MHRKQTGGTIGGCEQETIPYQRPLVSLHYPVHLKRSSLMFDDGDRELVSLKSGESAEGAIPAKLYFPDIGKDLEQTAVIFFWSYQMVLKDGRGLERSGGWFLIPRQVGRFVNSTKITQISLTMRLERYSRFYGLLT